MAEGVVPDTLDCQRKGRTYVRTHRGDIKQLHRRAEYFVEAFKEAQFWQMWEVCFPFTAEGYWHKNSWNKTSRLLVESSLTRLDEWRGRYLGRTVASSVRLCPLHDMLNKSVYRPLSRPSTACLLVTLELAPACSFLYVLKSRVEAANGRFVPPFCLTHVSDVAKKWSIPLHQSPASVQSGQPIDVLAVRNKYRRINLHQTLFHSTCAKWLQTEHFSMRGLTRATNFVSLLKFKVDISTGSYEHKY